MNRIPSGTVGSLNRFRWRGSGQAILLREDKFLLMRGPQGKFWQKTIALLYPFRPIIPRCVFLPGANHQ